MMRLVALLAIWPVCLAAEDPLQAALKRISAQAATFRSAAPKMIARETLVQRALKSRRHRFPVTIGSNTQQPVPADFVTREIVSEYGFAALKSAPGALHEFREVITVDGRHVATEAKARRSLAAGLISDDDRARKRMLESFERHGLVGAATDFGQIILLFSRPRLNRYDFRLAGDQRIGADRARVVVFKEKAAQGSLLVFERRQAIYQPLEGQIWVRERDGLPARVWLRAQRESGGVTMRDEATVDYVQSPHGTIVPASVVHRQFTGSQLTVENVFRYSPFQMFAAEAEITFP
jgi:hypothetical protein